MEQEEKILNEPAAMYWFNDIALAILLILYVSTIHCLNWPKTVIF